MANILVDICEDSPVLSPELARPKGVSKATVQRCISKLSPHWTDEQLDQVVELTGMGKTFIYARMKDGTFPKQIQLGSRSVTRPMGPKLI